LLSWLGYCSAGWVGGYRRGKGLLDFREWELTQASWAFGHRLPKMSFLLEDSSCWSKATQRFDQSKFLLILFMNEY
jgi:hypothetical protein